MMGSRGKTILEALKKQETEKKGCTNSRCEIDLQLSTKQDNFFELNSAGTSKQCDVIDNYDLHLLNTRGNNIDVNESNAIPQAKENLRFTELDDDSDLDKDFIPPDSESGEDSDVEVFKTSFKQKIRRIVRSSQHVTAESTRNESIQSNNQTSSKATRNGVFSRKKRAERKLKRNTGKSYVTAKGKHVKERVSIPLRSCRMKCEEKLEKLYDNEKTIREKIFEEYWSLANRNKRVQFVAALVDSTKPVTSRKRTTDPDKEKHRLKSYQFHFIINGERIRVCRGCFMQTLGETNMFITLALHNRSASLSGIISDDMRGQTFSANKHSAAKIQQVKDHILSFPLYRSHYTRKESSKKYLPPYLNQRIMYELYCEHNNGNGETSVSRQIYEREFHKMNLSFKEPKADTCHKCDLLQMKIKVADDSKKLDLELELQAHHLEADNAYIEKKNDKELAVHDENLLCYTFDLQQCLPTPMLNTSIAFYKRQLWTYNLTMYETSTGNVRCYMWHESEGGRGGNQIATCIYKELTTLPPNVSKVILYSDTCTGQNRNSYVAAMFVMAMQNNPNLVTVDHKFLVSGHTHLECDVDHGLIEKQKKKFKISISHPHDWYQLIRSVGKKKKFDVVELTHSDFLDFADLLKTSLQLRKKDSEGNPFNWLSVKWLRYTRELGTVLFKTSISKDEPFKSISLLRRNHFNTRLNPKKCYNSTLAISKEKKKDILDLSPLISPTFHDFYKSLKTNNTPADLDPDLEELENE